MGGFGGGLLDLLYPPQCLGCGRWFVFAEDIFLCHECVEELSLLPKLLGRRVNHLTVYSRFFYKNRIAKAIVHALKYERIYSAVHVISEWLGAEIRCLRENNVVFVPVPLHKNRYKERGFNQSDLICWSLVVKNSSAEINFDLIERFRETQPQAQLKEVERKQNMECVFVGKGVCDPNSLYVLVDDVVTSGSTMAACAEALKRVGATKIIGLTFATTNGEETIVDKCLF